MACLLIGKEGWNPSGISAHKNVDGEIYKGGNQLALMIETSLKGYTSPYWLTYNACKKLGGNINKRREGVSWRCIWRSCSD